MAFEIRVSWKDFGRLVMLNGGVFWLTSAKVENELAALGCRDAAGIVAAFAAGTLVMLIPEPGRNPGSVRVDDVLDPL